MKKLALTAALSLTALTGLTGCGGGSILGGEVAMTPRVSGADIKADLTYYLDATGAVSSFGVKTTTQQPLVSMEVASGSVGVTITGYTVTVVDSSGQRYGGADGQYKRSLAYHVLGGWACTDGKTVDSTTDQCSITGFYKTPYRRTVTLPESLPLVEPAIASVVGQQVLAGFAANSIDCPQLKMNITLTGYDDLNRTITPINVTGVPLIVTCNYIKG